MICRWVKEYIAEGEAAFVPKGHPGNSFAVLHTSKNLLELERLQLIVVKLARFACLIVDFVPPLNQNHYTGLSGHA